MTSGELSLGKSVVSVETEDADKLLNRPAVWSGARLSAHLSLLLLDFSLLFSQLQCQGTSYIHSETLILMSMSLLSSGNGGVLFLSSIISTFFAFILKLVGGDCFGPTEKVLYFF